MRTDDLRALVKAQLDGLKVKGVKEVYSKTASDNAGFPHVVFNLESVRTLFNDLNRYDYSLVIDIWDRSKSETTTLEICDNIEEMFSAVNLPQTNILPTFYYDSRQSVIDEDKDIKHQIIRFDVQLYEK